MSQILQVGRTVFFTTLIFQMAYLAIRNIVVLRDYASSWLLLSYGFWGTRLAFPPDSDFRLLFALLFLLALGNYISLLAAKRFSVVWNTVVIGFTLAMCLAILLGYSTHASFKLFVVISILFASLYPAYLMFSGARKGLSGFYYPSLVALILWLVISLLSCYLRQGARADLDLWFSILLLVVTFFVLVGWRSGVSQGHGVSSFGSGKKERELLKALINLDQTESIMLLQQRFISSGFLTASLIHDFKNIIAYIKACAEFGIRQPDTASKDRALKTVSDNVRSGSRAIISLLTSLASGHREERTRFRVKEFLREFVRSVRINYRIEEIQFSLRAREDPYITTRRGELEQVLLNLIRNSAQAFMRRITVEDKKIDISCSTNESALIIELRDNAGGISLDVQARLFEPPSGASPAGFGLYLAHRLVTQNGGSIEFHPLKNGSCFRIQLPK